MPDRLRAAGRLASILLLALAACPSAEPPSPEPLEISTWRSSEISARLNAHLVQGRHAALLVDATMTRDDARGVAAMIEASGRRLEAIFITNSQPDKYLGLPVLTARFPGVRVLATPEVAAEIRERAPGYHARLRGRWGDRIAASLVLPEPFDEDRYVLEGHELVVHRLQGGECPNAAVLYVPSLRAMLTGAVVFERSHLFLRERDIAGWRRHLEWIRSHGGIDVIHPGHGDPTDLTVLDRMNGYLDDFEAAAALGDADAIADAMVERYPDYALERLLREYSAPAFSRRPEDAGG